jgi:hypothetical protein
MRRKHLLLPALLLSLASAALGQNGPVTSNLKNVLVYVYGYTGDHGNTVQYAGHLMKLGQANGFAVDTTRSASVFTPANLAKYQAVVLFNAYNFGGALAASQKDALKAWYAQNRGLACFHQCTKNNWGGTPNWMDQLMGVKYQTFAGFGTGPVYVHADVAGTDLAMSGTGSPYAAGFKLSWNDEWYTYQANPEPLPNTRMIWTTRQAEHGFKFFLSTDVQPMAWAREVEGGRFVMNSMFHQDAPRTSTDPALRQFIDGAFVGTMRYIAGYTGCTDETNPNYNPKATHNDPNVCQPVGIRMVETGKKLAGRPGGVRVSVALPGPHAVEVFDAGGRMVFSRRGSGPSDYDFTRDRAGMHFVRVRGAGTTASQRFMLL